MENLKEEVYFHVCNGGATISIEKSEYGAKIKISTGSYGNCNTTTDITTDNEGVLALKELFERASTQNFEVNGSYSVAKARRCWEPIGYSKGSEGNSGQS